MMFNVSLSTIKGGCFMATEREKKTIHLFLPTQLVIRLDGKKK